MLTIFSHRRAQRRGCPVAGLAPTERVRATAARMGRAHLVTDDAAVAGRRTGRYRTVCRLRRTHS